MQTTAIGTTPLKSSRIVHGCMRLRGDNSPEARERGKQAVRAAIECGINHFDHADIYGGGECERIFAEVLREEPGLRDRLILTSKCGIRPANTPHQGAPARFDFSRDHILRAVEGSLERLGIETLDILLLHRPDYLGDPEEVASAFDSLHEAGKVRYFGVSNFSASQVDLLKAFCDQPLVMNQVEFNIHLTAPLENGVLDQCMRERITPEAWCPLGGVAYPAWHNTFTTEKQEEINQEIDAQAKRYGCSATTLILAWILRHPSGILPILGSMNAERIRDSMQALDLDYTREDWYHLLEVRNRPTK